MRRYCERGREEDRRRCGRREWVVRGGLELGGGSTADGSVAGGRGSAEGGQTTCRIR
jgi:hypothetical protein